MTDRSPIAALAQTLRSGAAQLREQAVTEKSRNMRLQLANSAVMLDDLAARIEAAIAAQVEAERWVPVGEPPAEIWLNRYLFAVAEVNKPGLYLPGKVFVGSWLERGSATHWRELPEGPKP